MVEDFTLRNGQAGVIWPLLTSDRRTTREQFRRLSEESRYNRFLTSVPELTEAMLDVLVDGPDGTDHVALVALALPDEGPEVLVGIGRVVRYAADPESADLAVSVLDDWQREGVASALLQSLMRRRPAGVRRLVACVRSDNKASLALMRQLGPAVVTPDDAGVLRVEVELEEPPTSLSSL